MVLLLVFAATSSHWRSVSHAAERSPASLGNLYAGPDGLVRDTNGDGVPDVVAARVVVPSAPSARDIENAANIAARLGYETAALTLPIVVHDTDVEQLESIERPIFVGRSNAFVRKLDASGVISLRTLTARQGLHIPVGSRARHRPERDLLRLLQRGPEVLEDPRAAGFAPDRADRAVVQRRQSREFLDADQQPRVAGVRPGDAVAAVHQRAVRARSSSRFATCSTRHALDS